MTFNFGWRRQHRRRRHGRVGTHGNLLRASPAWAVAWTRLMCQSRRHHPEVQRIASNQSCYPGQAPRALPRLPLWGSGRQLLMTRGGYPLKASVRRSRDYVGCSTGHRAVAHTEMSAVLPIAAQTVVSG